MRKNSIDSSSSSGSPIFHHERSVYQNHPASSATSPNLIIPQINASSHKTTHSLQANSNLFAASQDETSPSREEREVRQLNDFYEAKQTRIYEQQKLQGRIMNMDREANNLGCFRTTQPANNNNVTNQYDSQSCNLLQTSAAAAVGSREQDSSILARQNFDPTKLFATKEQQNFMSGNNNDLRPSLSLGHGRPNDLPDAEQKALGVPRQRIEGKNPVNNQQMALNQYMQSFGGYLKDRGFSSAESQDFQEVIGSESAQFDKDSSLGYQTRLLHEAAGQEDRETLRRYRSKYQSSQLRSHMHQAKVEKIFSQCDLEPSQKKLEVTKLSDIDDPADNHEKQITNSNISSTNKSSVHEINQPSYHQRDTELKEDQATYSKLQQSKGASVSNQGQFSQIIPNSWSSSGLYKQDKSGKSSAYDAIPSSSSATSNTTFASENQQSIRNVGTKLRNLRYGTTTSDQQNQLIGQSSQTATSYSSRATAGFGSHHIATRRFPLVQANKGDMASTYASATQTASHNISSGRLGGRVGGTSGQPSHHTTQNSEQANVAHFFESHSKYIPLRSFNQLYAQPYAEQAENFVQADKSSQDAKPQVSVIKKWFQQLSLSEKSVALTTVDKDLVNLFKAMYKINNAEGPDGGGGEFLAKLDRCESSRQADSYKKVGQFQLLHRRQPDLRTVMSSYMGRQRQAANTMIEAVRIVSINQPNDALTLNVEFFSNSQFFFEMMKLIDDQFMIREYKQTRTVSNKVQGSLFVGVTASQLAGDNSNIGELRHTSSRTAKEKPYFLMKDDQRQLFPASSMPGMGPGSTASNKDHRDLQMPGYSGIGRGFDYTDGHSLKNNKNHVTLAQCLVHVFEKALNVQFAAYMDTLAQQAQTFFLIKKDLQAGIFSEDLKIADFWQKQTKTQREKLLSPLNEICSDLLKVFRETKSHLNYIEERESETEELDLQEDSDLSQHRSHSPLLMDEKDHKNQLLYDQSVDLLRKLKRENRQDKSALIQHTLPTEYTECHGQLITSTTSASGNNKESKSSSGLGLAQNFSKQRRSRKDRKDWGGTALSGTGTVSSLGSDFCEKSQKKQHGQKNKIISSEKPPQNESNKDDEQLVTNIYEYNGSQLMGEYGAGGGERNDDNNTSCDDLELGLPNFSNKDRKRESNNYRGRIGVRDYQINDSSDQDDEFSDGQASGFDQDADSPRDRTTFSNNHDLQKSKFYQQSKPANQKKPKKNIKISVTANPQHSQKFTTDFASIEDKFSDSDQKMARNDLFDEKRPESILFKHKQEIRTYGLKADSSFQECLQFVKILSMSKPLEYAINEPESTSTNVIQAYAQPPISLFSTQTQTTTTNSKSSHSSQGTSNTNKKKKGKAGLSSNGNQFTSASNNLGGGFNQLIGNSLQQQGYDNKNTSGGKCFGNLTPWQRTDMRVASKVHLMTYFLDHLHKECLNHIYQDLLEPSCGAAENQSSTTNAAGISSSAGQNVSNTKNSDSNLKSAKTQGQQDQTNQSNQNGANSKQNGSTKVSTSQQAATAQDISTGQASTTKKKNKKKSKNKKKKNKGGNAVAVKQSENIAQINDHESAQKQKTDEIVINSEDTPQQDPTSSDIVQDKANNLPPQKQPGLKKEKLSDNEEEVEMQELRQSVEQKDRDDLLEEQFLLNDKESGSNITLIGQNGPKKEGEEQSLSSQDQLFMHQLATTINQQAGSLIRENHQHQIETLMSADEIEAKMIQEETKQVQDDNQSARNALLSEDRNGHDRDGSKDLLLRGDQNKATPGAAANSEMASQDSFSEKWARIEKVAQEQDSQLAAIKDRYERIETADQMLEYGVQWPEIMEATGLGTGAKSDKSVLESEVENDSDEVEKLDENEEAGTDEEEAIQTTSSLFAQVKKSKRQSTTTMKAGSKADRLRVLERNSKAFDVQDLSGVVATSSSQSTQLIKETQKNKQITLDDLIAQAQRGGGNDQMSDSDDFSDNDQYKLTAPGISAPLLLQKGKDDESLGRIFEERKGLLSNQVHLDKYPQESLAQISDQIHKEFYDEESLISQIDQNQRDRKAQIQQVFEWQAFQERSTRLNSNNCGRDFSSQQSSSQSKSQQNRKFVTDQFSAQAINDNRLAAQSDSSSSLDNSTFLSDPKLTSSTTTSNIIYDKTEKDYLDEQKQQISDHHRKKWHMVQPPPTWIGNAGTGLSQSIVEARTKRDICTLSSLDANLDKLKKEVVSLGDSNQNNAKNSSTQEDRVVSAANQAQMVGSKLRQRGEKASYGGCDSVADKSKQVDQIVLMLTKQEANKDQQSAMNQNQQRASEKQTTEVVVQQGANLANCSQNNDQNQSKQKLKSSLRRKNKKRNQKNAQLKATQTVNHVQSQPTISTAKKQKASLEDVEFTNVLQKSLVVPVKNLPTSATMEAQDFDVEEILLDDEKPAESESSRPLPAKVNTFFENEPEKGTPTTKVEVSSDQAKQLEGALTLTRVEDHQSVMVNDDLKQHKPHHNRSCLSPNVVDEQSATNQQDSSKLNSITSTQQMQPTTQSTTVVSKKQKARANKKQKKLLQHQQLKAQESKNGKIQETGRVSQAITQKAEVKEIDKNVDKIGSSQNEAIMAERQQFEGSKNVVEKNLDKSHKSSISNPSNRGPLHYTPFATGGMKRSETSSTHKFQADLSDKIAIPKRGTSLSSFGRKEAEHSTILQELDSLFPEKSKTSPCSSQNKTNAKIRSVTISKTRVPRGKAGLTTSSKFVVQGSCSSNDGEKNQKGEFNEIQSQKACKSKQEKLLISRSKSPSNQPILNIEREMDSNQLKLPNLRTQTDLKSPRQMTTKTQENNQSALHAQSSVLQSQANSNLQSQKQSKKALKKQKKAALLVSQNQEKADQQSQSKTGLSKNQPQIQEKQEDSQIQPQTLTTSERRQLTFAEDKFVETEAPKRKDRGRREDSHSRDNSRMRNVSTKQALIQKSLKDQKVSGKTKYAEKQSFQTVRSVVTNSLPSSTLFQKKQPQKQVESVQAPSTQVQQSQGKGANFSSFGQMLEAAFGAKSISATPGSIQQAQSQKLSKDVKDTGKKEAIGENLTEKKKFDQKQSKQDLQAGFEQQSKDHKADFFVKKNDFSQTKSQKQSAKQFQPTSYEPDSKKSHKKENPIQGFGCMVTPNRKQNPSQASYLTQDGTWQMKDKFLLATPHLTAQQPLFQPAPTPNPPNPPLLFGNTNLTAGTTQNILLTNHVQSQFQTLNSTFAASQQQLQQHQTLTNSTGLGKMSTYTSSKVQTQQNQFGVSQQNNQGQQIAQVSQTSQFKLKTTATQKLEEQTQNNSTTQLLNRGVQFGASGIQVNNTGNDQTTGEEKKNLNEQGSIQISRGQQQQVSQVNNANVTVNLNIMPTPAGQTQQNPPIQTPLAAQVNATFVPPSTNIQQHGNPLITPQQFFQQPFAQQPISSSQANVAEQISQTSTSINNGNHQSQQPNASAFFQQNSQTINLPANLNVNDNFFQQYMASFLQAQQQHQQNQDQLAGLNPSQPSTNHPAALMYPQAAQLLNHHPMANPAPTAQMFGQLPGVLLTPNGFIQAPQFPPMIPQNQVSATSPLMPPSSQSVHNSTTLGQQAGNTNTTTSTPGISTTTNSMLLNSAIENDLSAEKTSNTKTSTTSDNVLIAADLMNNSNDKKSEEQKSSSILINSDDKTTNQISSDQQQIKSQFSAIKVVQISEDSSKLNKNQETPNKTAPKPESTKISSDQKPSSPKQSPSQSSPNQSTILTISSSEIVPSAEQTNPSSQTQLQNSPKQQQSKETVDISQNTSKTTSASNLINQSPPNSTTTLPPPTTSATMLLESQAVPSVNTSTPQDQNQNQTPKTSSSSNTAYQLDQTTPQQQFGQQQVLTTGSATPSSSQVNQHPFSFFVPQNLSSQNATTRQQLSQNPNGNMSTMWPPQTVSNQGFVGPPIASDQQVQTHDNPATFDQLQRATQQFQQMQTQQQSLSKSSQGQGQGQAQAQGVPTASTLQEPLFNNAAQSSSQEKTHQNQNGAPPINEQTRQNTSNSVGQATNSNEPQNQTSSRLNPLFLPQMPILPQQANASSQPTNPQQTHQTMMPFEAQNVLSASPFHTNQNTQLQPQNTHHHLQVQGNHYPSYNQVPNQSNQQRISSVYQPQYLHQQPQNQPSIFEIKSLVSELRQLNRSSGSSYHHAQSQQFGGDKREGWLTNEQQATLRDYESNFYQLIGQQIQQMQAQIEAKLKKSALLRSEVFDRLLNLAKETYSDAKERIQFKMYGSMATGLAIDSSDMDIQIDGVLADADLMQSANPMELAVENMDLIFDKLQRLDWIDQSQLLDKATVPVIKLVINLQKLVKKQSATSEGTSTVEIKDESGEGQSKSEDKLLKIDLIFNDVLRAKRLQESQSGKILPEEADLQSTQRCAVFIKQKVEEEPFLKPLAIVFKKFLALKNLNSPFQGTMSSYGLVLMILTLLNDIKRQNSSFQEPIDLQHQVQQSLNLHSRFSGPPTIKIDEIQLQINLGMAFAHFMNVFGEGFNTAKFCIDENCEFGQVQDQNQSNQNSFTSFFTIPQAGLQVFDPIDPLNNVGKQTYNFSLVQDNFVMTRQLLVDQFQSFTDSKHKLGEFQRLSILLDRQVQPQKSSSNKTQKQQEKQEKAAKKASEEGETKQLTDIVISEGVNSQSCFDDSEASQILKSRSKAQLKLDKSALESSIDQQQALCGETELNLLARVIFIDCKTLESIKQEKVEEKQRLASLKRENGNFWIEPYHRLCLSIDHQNQRNLFSQLIQLGATSGSQGNHPRATSYYGGSAGQNMRGNHQSFQVGNQNYPHNLPSNPNPNPNPSQAVYTNPLNSSTRQYVNLSEPMSMYYYNLDENQYQTGAADPQNNPMMSHVPLSNDLHLNQQFPPNQHQLAMSEYNSNSHQQQQQYHPHPHPHPQYSQNQNYNSYGYNQQNNGGNSGSANHHHHHGHYNSGNTNNNHHYHNHNQRHSSNSNSNNAANYHQYHNNHNYNNGGGGQNNSRPNNHGNTYHRKNNNNSHHQSRQYNNNNTHHHNQHNNQHNNQHHSHSHSHNHITATNQHQHHKQQSQNLQISSFRNNSSSNEQQQQPQQIAIQQSQQQAVIQQPEGQQQQQLMMLQQSQQQLQQQSGVENGGSGAGGGDLENNQNSYALNQGMVQKVQHSLTETQVEGSQKVANSVNIQQVQNFAANFAGFAQIQGRIIPNSGADREKDLENFTRSVQTFQQIAAKDKIEKKEEEKEEGTKDVQRKQSSDQTTRVSSQHHEGNNGKKQSNQSKK